MNWIKKLFKKKEFIPKYKVGQTVEFYHRHEKKSVTGVIKDIGFHTMKEFYLLELHDSFDHRGRPMEISVHEDNLTLKP